MTGILFNPLFPVSWVILFSILLFSGLAWLEIKRRQRFLIARIIFLLLAVLSLAALILNPVRLVKKSSNLILLTSGYKKEILDSLINLYPESQLYKLKGVTGSNQATEIRSYRDLSELKGNLTILGEGVPEYMIDYLDTTSLHFFPTEITEGFTVINSSRSYFENQSGQLDGMYTSNSIRTIKLNGPGKTEDSVRLERGLQAFSLHFSPKSSGLYSYTLTATDSSAKIINTQQIPIQVEEQKPLSVFFLNDYPSAEVRFLKNFLEKKNHQLTLRYKISKDKYRTEFVNTPQKNFGRVNEELLKSFDLVITDASSLGSLSGAEISNLKASVKFGLGVLTVINTTILSGRQSDFLNLRLTKIKNDSAQVLLNKQRFKFSATPVNISSERKLFSISSEPSGRMISGYYSIGLGKSGFQLITNTYSLELAGETETYAEIWSGLIQTVARKELKKYDLRFVSQFPYYPDEPVEFKIIAAGEKPVVSIDSIEIPLIEDPLVKNVWYGKTWAGQSGWNSLRIRQDSSQYNFFVSQPEAEQSLRITNQQKALAKISSPEETFTEQIIRKPVPVIIFYIIFLLSAGFLWLAPKL